MQGPKIHADGRPACPWSISTKIGACKRGLTNGAGQRSMALLSERQKVKLRIDSREGKDGGWDGMAGERRGAADWEHLCRIQGISEVWKTRR